MATFVLVHGACHGGWCWEKVVPLLRSEGHVVRAPDLPGMGADRTALAEDVLSQWVDAAARLVAPQARSTVLVGHSLGGSIISALSERMPDRVALAIFLAGTLLADGEAVLGAGILSEALEASVVPNAAGTAGSIRPEAARDIFYNGVQPEVADRAIARLVEQPFQPVTTPLHLTPERFGKVTKSYIETADDRAILIEKQREMQKKWPCDDIVQMPGGHSPFYQSPEALVVHLHRLASKYSI